MRKLFNLIQKYFALTGDVVYLVSVATEVEVKVATTIATQPEVELTNSKKSRTYVKWK